ncbi:GNAT family N-acetyltransferase [Tropicimonas omnivorans]|uniref:GNAT family N-acetyltransferase n=1 Tax=Tropicimonas omnivorans TaxID=3075590 RepID=UPI003D770037
MDCLFVAQPCRGLGIRGRLLAKVVQSARDAETLWLEWQKPQWNTAATNVYLRNSAEILEKKRFRLSF